jgi:hypothetical protein
MWLHTGNGEHYVGIANDIKHEGNLIVSYAWLIRIETDRDNGPSIWRPIPGSKKERNTVTFPSPSLKSLTENKLEIRDGEDAITMCIGGERLVEANEILSRL